MTDYIAAINFPERSKTYEAFSKIKADSERLGVVSAALVEIDENGRVTVPEGEDARAGLGMGAGSLIGVLVGALGGPIGMLLGLGVGAMTGAAVDAGRAEAGGLAVATLAGTLAPGTNGILVQTSEPGSTAPLDAVVASRAVRSCAARSTRFWASSRPVRPPRRRPPGPPARRCVSASVRSARRTWTSASRPFGPSSVAPDVRTAVRDRISVPDGVECPRPE